MFQRPPTTITSVVAQATGTGTPTRMLYARKDDSSDSSASSSGSKTSTTDPTKCTGTKEQCQKPADHNMSTTIGVAVAIPVFVVIVFLGGILFCVYRRGKKEALEDNDPDFDGDEYINTAYVNHQMQMQQQGYYNPDPRDNNPQQMRDEFSAVHQQRPPLATNPFGKDSYTSVGTKPFHIPESGDVHSLRNFAREIKMDGSSGYNLASKSRNASRSSLGQSTTFGSQQHYSSGPSALDSESHYLDEKEPAALYSQEFASERELAPADNEEQFQQQAKEVRIGRLPSTNSDGEPLSPAEEENIRRMKSIYKVYLDRNDTLKTNAPPPEQEPEQEEEDVGNDTVVLPSIEPAVTYEYADSHVPVEAVDAIPTQSYNSGAALSPEKPALGHATQPSQSTDISHMTAPLDTSSNRLAPIDTTNNRQTSYRIASSIYSELPKPAATASINMPQQQQQGNQYQQMQYPPQQQYAQQYPQQYAPQYPQQQQQMPYIQQYQQQYYNMPQNSYIPQRNHPQTLESIGELPTPTQLAHGMVPSHSLTSFRKPSKQQFQMQTARMNGTALNIMDNPEMFYAQSDNQFMPPNQFGNDTTSIATGGTQSTGLHPHQMRNSIVMTNPSELQVNTLYKPAGSFRKFNDPYSRNNSMNSQANTYQQYVQNQMHTRVSGILEEEDILQPPSVPGILPHSGSSEDLRKQLGSSHNFNVPM